MAINGTMVFIDSVTVGSGGAASIEFTNIPQTYDDLVLLCSFRVERSTTASTVVMNFNNSSSNYSGRTLVGDGSTASSGLNGVTTDIRNITVNANTSTANTFANTMFYIPNYKGSTAKSVSIDSVMENNATTSFQNLTAALWNDTSAITSIKFAETNGPSDIAQHSTAYLYGVSRTTVKATGGMITETDTHIIHTFTSSSTFIPNENLTDVDFLVVAGGGGSLGHGMAGGGGAGGLRTSIGSVSGGGVAAQSKINFNSSTSYSIVVGAGGPASAHNSGGTSPSVGNGSASSISGLGFTTISCVGGGGGGDYANSGSTFSQNGATGGSGGGAGGSGDVDWVGGAGTSGEGYSGGNNLKNGSVGGNGGGGGGAGSVGLAPITSSGANDGGVGGSGLSINISGTDIIYAKGGKGGRISSGAANGAANTGNGADRALSGGSGIVIIRYAK